jgi:HTH-type transcriptional regulator/antitoxin HigA
MSEPTPSLFSARLPGDVIREYLAARGWTQDDLAKIIQRPRSALNEAISGKRPISTELAISLAAAFGNTPEFWLELEMRYRLARVLPAERVDDVHRRSRVYAMAPVREMERRGWIAPTTALEGTEAELSRFFGVPSLVDEPQIGAATRRADGGQPLTASQRAWCFRVRQLGKAQLAGAFDERNLDRCEAELRKIAAYPQEVHKVPGVLSKYGIRFVIVEPLQSTKVDGVALWLDRDSPVIGLSLRYDRVDSFWFTLCHELSHVRHRDEAPLDEEIGGDSSDSISDLMVVKNEMERRANEEAANTLIPRDEMESFVKRVGPLYSKDRIVRFAHRIKIHPGVIVGQLQRRREIGYAANREMLAKVRHVIAPAALTDGWGHVIDRRSLP